MIHDNTILASWEIPEYEERARTTDWYWIVGFLALAAIVVSILFHNYLFALVILIGTALIITYSIRKPQIVEVQVSVEGIMVSHVFYPYDQMRAFWITEEVVPSATVAGPDQNALETIQLSHHLLLATKNWYHPFVKIILPPDMNPFELREFLLQYMQEAEITEPIGYKISERLGF